MKRNWSNVDKMALEAMRFVFDYCDMIDCCDDCIFHDEEEDRCSIKQNQYAIWFMSLSEKRRKENTND